MRFGGKKKRQEGDLRRFWRPRASFWRPKKSRSGLVCRCWGEVGGMAGRPWQSQEHSEYSWSTEKFHTPAILSGCGGYLKAPPVHRPLGPKALGAPWGACRALWDACGRFWTLLGALGVLLGGFGMGFWKVWCGPGESLGWFLQQASSRSSSKAVPYDRACFGLLGHAFA